MDHLHFEPADDEQLHDCESFRDGDWIVFLCPQCHDYERRLNWRTGEMKVRDNSNGTLRHRGEYYPKEYDYMLRFAN